MSSGFLQCEHSLRPSRCAVIRITDEAMLNGATPMLSSRVSVVGRVVGVQRRQHEVARLRRLDRDVRGFEVADFADHDDVRILAQERLQRDRERQARLVVDVDLVDAGKLDFRRVLGGRDVDAGLVQDVEAGVQRHRLAAAGRAGDEDHAVRPPDREQQSLPAARARSPAPRCRA